MGRILLLKDFSDYTTHTLFSWLFTMFVSWCPTTLLGINTEGLMNDPGIMPYFKNYLWGTFWQIRLQPRACDGTVPILKL